MAGVVKLTKVDAASPTEYRTEDGYRLIKNGGMSWRLIKPDGSRMRPVTNLDAGRKAIAADRPTPDAGEFSPE